MSNRPSPRGRKPGSCSAGALTGGNPMTLEDQMDRAVENARAKALDDQQAAPDCPECGGELRVVVAAEIANKGR